MRATSLSRWVVVGAFLASAAVVAVGLPDPEPASAIYGGEDADITEFPFMVSVQEKLEGSWTHVCGGTLVDPGWVLTAAHCVADFKTRTVTDAKELRVVVGQDKGPSGDWEDPPVPFLPARREVGDPVFQMTADGSSLLYFHAGNASDVALLPLRKPVFGVATVPMAYGEWPAGTMMTAAGWGSTYDYWARIDSPSQLQKIDHLEVRTDAACWEGDPEKQNIANVQICTKAPDGVLDRVLGGFVVGGPRKGDSGGPLLRWQSGRWLQVGIASHIPQACSQEFEETRCDFDAPTVESGSSDDDGDPNFTGWMSVPRVRSWISSIIVSGSSAPSSEVATVLIVDSSGSMGWNDPQQRRLDAARTYVTGALASDEVGVVDFDSSVIVRSPVVKVGPNRDALLAAIGQIDASGGTDLGAGLQAGCDALQSATARRRAAIFLTDGEGSYSGQSSCFASSGWPVFTIGLGSGVDASLLSQVAADTGGEYRSLATATNLVCEFQRIRSLVAGVAASTCEPTADIVQGQTVSLFRTVRSLLSQITFTNTWLGSDIEMTLTSPSGQVFNRSSSGDGVSASHGPTFESITVLNPEAGEWSVSFYGAEIPEGGEPFTFSTSSIDLPDDQLDTDGDGLTDPFDNCPYHENPSQDDFDNDGFGDVCDTDPGLLESPSAPVPDTTLQLNVDRVWGADRIATAIAVSKDQYGAASAPVVVLTRSDGFADALTATPLAVGLGGPLLLTSPDSLSSEVTAELARVIAPGGRVIIVGGVNAVAAEVEDQLTAAGFTVERVHGADRYATAVQVASRLPSPKVIIVATGVEFADALTGGVAAATAEGVVILSNGELLPEVSADFIEKHPGVRVVALGGPAATAARLVPGVVPLVGANRYATAVLAANEFFSSPDGAGVASGVAFPDSLTGGVAVAASGWPMLLTAPDSLPPAIERWFSEERPRTVRVFGGSAAVTDKVVSELTAAAR